MLVCGLPMTIKHCTGLSEIIISTLMEGEGRCYDVNRSCRRNGNLQ